MSRIIKIVLVSKGVLRDFARNNILHFWQLNPIRFLKPMVCTQVH